MSAVLIQTIVFNGVNPFGGFITNDIVECFYDASSDASPTNSTSGITVKLNGSIITSGSTIADPLFNAANPSPITYSFSGFGINGICNAGYLVSFLYVSFVPDFPYLLKFSLQDHTDCSINPTVCDLSFSPNTILNYPSSATSNDGSITVNATSSNSIKYKLSDFDYNDGTGQTSNIFASLYPGNYRIYARDSINCGSNIYVSLPFQNVYYLLYTTNYINIRGHRTKIDIVKRNYGGSPSNIVCGGTPLQLSLRGESNLDKFNPILSTEAIIQIVAQAQGQYRELFTNDPRQYKVNVYKDVSGGTDYSLIFSGFIIPQVYQEQFISTPYTIQVSASDNLSDLSNYAFLKDDGTKFLGSIKCITLISILLRKIGLELWIRSGVNLFADSMTQSASDDPLDQAYVDVDSYYIAEEIPTFGSVLTKILKPFRSVLMQSNGYWQIIRPEECTSSFNYRQFDPQGNYSANGSYNPLVDIKNATSTNRFVWKDQDQTLQIRPGIGKLRIKYHLGLNDNILRNGDFSIVSEWSAYANAYIYKINLYGFQVVGTNYPVSTSYELIDQKDLNSVALSLTGKQSDMSQPLGYVQSIDYPLAMGAANSLKISVNIKLQSGLVYNLAVDGSGNLVTIPIKASFYYQKIRLRVYYGGKYLLNDGTWTNIPSDVVFYSTQWDQYVDFNITATWPDATFSTEKTFNVRCYHSWANDVDFTSISKMRKRVTNSSVIISGSSNRLYYNASSGLFPSSGGSGTSGALKAGDFWTVNVQGTIQGILCVAGTKLRVVYDPPGQSMDNWLIGDITLAEGSKTEIRDSAGLGVVGIHYYELKNNTSSESVPNIIRPNDYNASTNPYQWVRVFSGADFDLRPYITTYINKIQVQYLDNGQSAFDTIISDKTGEANNSISIEDEIYHGSLNSLVESVSSSVLISNLANPVSGAFNPTGGPLNFQLSDQFPNNRTIFSNIVNIPITQNILSGKLIYTGFLRDSSGNGFDKWSRPGFSDSTGLHVVWLSTTIAQYFRSWRKITGSLDSDIYAPFMSTFKDNIDGCILYRPASITLDDKNNSYSGEFLEIISDTSACSGGGSDGSSRAHSSGFSTGFS